MEENNRIYPIHLLNKDYRLKTMTNWATPFSNRRLLADAGFYYMRYVNTREMIKCVYCDLEISSSAWETSVDPVEIHKNLSPQCAYIKQLNSSITTIRQTTHKEQSLDLNLNKSRKSYGVVRESIVKENSSFIPVYKTFVSEEVRRQSFKSASWPKHFISQPEYLSKVGFFYSGQKTKTTCFQCGGTYEFEEQDDAFVKHKLSFPYCFLVVQHNLLEDTERLCSRIRRSLQFMPRQPDLINSPEQLANSNLTSKGDQNLDKLCKICFQRKSSKLMYPCGHMTCDCCAVNLKNCAFCRQLIKDQVRAYT